MNKILKLIFLLSLLVFVSSCATVVDPGKVGLKWYPISEGLCDVPLKNGLYMHFPWNDVIQYSLQWRSYSEKVDVLTKDDLHVEVVTSVIVRPIESEIYKLQLEIGNDFYPNVVKPKFQTVVRSELANYIMVEIPENSVKIEERITAKLKERIKGRHLEIDSVTLNHIEYTAGMLKAIEGKLAKEQEQTQKQFELEIAKTDADITRVRAKGEADAIVIRARAEAESQKIIDATLTKRFIQFKAFDSPNSKTIYVPTGKDGLPIIISAGAR